MIFVNIRLYFYNLSHCRIMSVIKYNLANIQKRKQENAALEDDPLNLTGQPLGCSFTLDTDDSLLDENAHRFGRRRYIITAYLLKIITGCKRFKAAKYYRILY